MARHVTRVSCGHSAPALGAVQTRVNRREATWGTQDSYSFNVTRTKIFSSPENADCCRADLLFVSTGVILPLLRELKFAGLDEDDLPKSSGVKPLLMVFPYKSSILWILFKLHIWH